MLVYQLLTLFLREEPIEATRSKTAGSASPLYVRYGRSARTQSAPTDHMRVYRDDQKFLQFRINAVLWGIVAVFVFLAGSFWFVQGVQAEKYRGLSEANALREIEIPAKRGLIMDRTGKILADNQPAYTLQIDRVVMKPLIKADKQRRAKLTRFSRRVLAASAGRSDGAVGQGVGASCPPRSRSRSPKT